MLIVPSNDRGTTRLPWLLARHSFSFGDYHDPTRMGFHALRVLNDDRIGPGGGFDTHPHRDMEIISIVLDGALAHRDSLGHERVIRPGEVQVMTAGRGIRHSEFNPDPAHATRLLQVWIHPERRALEPAYAEASFPRAQRLGVLRRVAGRDDLDRDGALPINQDADVYIGALERGTRLSHELRPGRGAWIQVARGGAVVYGAMLEEGDGAAIDEPGTITIQGSRDDTEVLLFDLA